MSQDGHRTSGGMLRSVESRRNVALELVEEYQDLVNVLREPRHNLPGGHKMTKKIMGTEQPRCRFQFSIVYERIGEEGFTQVHQCSLGFTSEQRMDLIFHVPQAKTAQTLRTRDGQSVPRQIAETFDAELCDPPVEGV